MDLSRRDAFRPCSEDSTGDKDQLCLISQKKKKKIVIGIGPPYLFYMSSRATQLLQNFSSTSLYQPPLPSIYCQLKIFKIYHCYKAVAKI